MRIDEDLGRAELLTEAQRVADAGRTHRGQWSHGRLSACVARQSAFAVVPRIPCDEPSGKTMLKKMKGKVVCFDITSCDPEAVCCGGKHRRRSDHIDYCENGRDFYSGIRFQTYANVRKVLLTGLDSMPYV